MTLRLRFRGGTRIPVEVEGITPDLVKTLDLAAIEKLPIFEGNRPAALADFFDVAGDASDECIEWEGDLRGVHWIGCRMKSGRMRIEGSTGRHIGSEMRGGAIHVAGNVSDWLGGEMHGGLIHVRGHAGHLVGAAYRGSPKGMTRGTILVEGDAGNEIGHSMRRGLIVVGGSAGDLAGFNMLAGTILLMGECGIRHGAGMRRGTIGLLGANSPTILPTFRRACRWRPQALNLLLRDISSRGFPVSPHLFDSDIDQYVGDMIEGGRGELWVRAGTDEDERLGVLTADARTKTGK